MIFLYLDLAKQLPYKRKSISIMRIVKKALCESMWLPPTKNRYSTPLTVL